MRILALACLAAVLGGIGSSAAAPLDLKERAHVLAPEGQGEGLVLYTFWSVTCPICHQMKKDMAEVEGIDWRMIPVGFSDEGWQWAVEAVGLDAAGNNLRLARELEIRGTPTSFIQDGDTLYRIRGGRPASFWEELPARFKQMQRRDRTGTGSWE